MESFEKRKRERKKQELRKEKAARKLQGVEPSGPSQEDYFADPGAIAEAPAAKEGEDASADPASAPSSKAAQSPPSIEGRGGAN